MFIRNKFVVPSGGWIQRGRKGKKNERPVGVPAALGHGVMEVQTFEALGGGLEYIHSVPFAFGGVDRPLGSFGPGTKVPLARFAAPSL